MTYIYITISFLVLIIILRLFLLKIFYKNKNIDFLILRANKPQIFGGLNLGWIKANEVVVQENVKIRKLINISYILLISFLVIMIALGCSVPPSN